MPLSPALTTTSMPFWELREATELVGGALGPSPWATPRGEAWGKGKRLLGMLVCAEREGLDCVCGG